MMPKEKLKISTENTILQEDIKIMNEAEEMREGINLKGKIRKKAYGRRKIVLADIMFRLHKKEKVLRRKSTDRLPREKATRLSARLQEVTPLREEAREAIPPRVAEVHRQAGRTRRLRPQAVLRDAHREVRVAVHQEVQEEDKKEWK